MRKKLQTLSKIVSWCLIDSYLLAGNSPSWSYVWSPPESPGKSCRCPRRRKRFVLTWQSSLTPQQNWLFCQRSGKKNVSNFRPLQQLCIWTKIAWNAIISPPFFGVLPLSFRWLLLFQVSFQRAKSQSKRWEWSWKTARWSWRNLGQVYKKLPGNLTTLFLVKRTGLLRYGDFAEVANESLLKEARITTYTNQIGVLSQVQWWNSNHASPALFTWTLKTETCQATNHQNLSQQQWQNVVTKRHLRKWQIVTQVFQ